jgi:cobyrinic acid a,c-diamide synthase
LTLGIISAFKHLGKEIAPFKKGPDYIDAGWLGLAADRPCYNLDTFLIQPERVLQSFQSHLHPGDVAVIEGNRGLFDCINTEGTTSTAELSKLLNVPVIICLDCTKTTRTMAAVLSGLMAFDPQVPIGGVVLNRVAGARHENILRQSIEGHCRIPVLGAIPKLRQQNFPERHMGLVPTPEHDWAGDSIEAALNVALKYLDLDALLQVAGSGADHRTVIGAEPMDEVVIPPQIHRTSQVKPRIGVIRDSAFQFYYPENLEALETEGAQLTYLSPLNKNSFPELDGMYIGGGFPETHADQLAANLEFKKHVKALADDGGPIYAECGGLMYLGDKLVLEGNTYTMCGILPVDFGFSRKPQGHGYTILEVEGVNPFYPPGMEIRGHEFHYSNVQEWRGDDADLAFKMKRGTGFHHQRDGVCYNNVLATYTHIHALGTPSWAKSLVARARAYAQKTLGSD